jgi:Ca2+-binding EF-hand superfamily protein
MDSLDNFVELRTAFQLFDKDKDGLISRNELKKAIIELGHDCKEEDIDEIFKLYDCKDGIEFHTFLEIAYEKKFCTKSLELDLIETFKIFDRDNMNYITSVDLKYILKNFCKTLSPNEIDMLMKEVDPRGDGEITFEQFVKLILMK